VILIFAANFAVSFLCTWLLYIYYGEIN